MKRIYFLFLLIIVFSNLKCILSLQYSNANSDGKYDIVYKRIYRRLSPKGEHQTRNYDEEFIEIFKTKLRPPMYDTTDQALNKFLLCDTITQVQRPKISSTLKPVFHVPTSQRPTPNYLPPATTTTQRTVINSELITTTTEQSTSTTRVATTAKSDDNSKEWTDNSIYSTTLKSEKFNSRGSNESRSTTETALSTTIKLAIEREHSSTTAQTLSTERSTDEYEDSEDEDEDYYQS